ncbi:hypothetical protein ZYGM_002525 [Zygosaccharomyces mellis]|uniref:Uncharacterized protein n=1 Tax=Zygosaccharomyces mellis TaxID=42258 RepID=A0A4C2E986_9SACH|nr:hypothetical protein ZYGM_002525 [Zygosaccharomyces mellis]
MSVATSVIAEQPIVTSVTLGITEFPTSVEGKTTQEVVKKLVVTPANGVKNSNPVIEEAIEGFEFLFSQPKSKDNKIKFGENQTITYDVNEEVHKLVSQNKGIKNCSENFTPLTSILKPGSIFVNDSTVFENNDMSYLDDDDEKTQAYASNQDIITLFQRIFTLHGISILEIRQDLVTTLQILALSVVKSFKQREECYKYVGRKQCIEELDELEYMNGNLKCEVASLNKKLNDERVKWEVVDEIFAENDSLKVKVEELTSAKQELVEELQLAPKWEDVDGLLEEDRQLNLKICQLSSMNNNLKKKYSQIDITTSKLTSEYERVKGELVLLREKIHVEWKEMATRFNQATEKTVELKKEQVELNTKLCASTKSAEKAAIELEKTKERIQDLYKIIKDDKKRNAELVFSYQQLTKKSKQWAPELRNTEFAGMEPVSATADTISKFHDTRRTVDILTCENAKIKKKMRLMKKKIYNRFFDQNITLKSRNEEFEEKLEQTLGQLEKFRNLEREYDDLTLEDNGSAAKQDVLILMNRDLSQRLEAETWRVKQLEKYVMATQDGISSLNINQRCEGQRIKGLPQENFNTDVKVCQWGILCGEIASSFICLDHELNSARTTINGLRKIEHVPHPIGNDQRLIQTFQKWEGEDHRHFQGFEILQHEYTALLKKCKNLEVEKSGLQSENLELSGYKKQYILFDEKYEWLESVALSLRQEKKCSDNRIKDLQRNLKDTKKTIDSMGKTKIQYKRSPQDPQIELDRLKTQNLELCQRFKKKDKELRESFDKMREMAVMLRSTMGIAKTLSPREEVTLVEPHNYADKTLKCFFPLKWWRSST